MAATRDRVERILEEQDASAGMLIYDFAMDPPRLLAERPHDKEAKVPSAVVVMLNAPVVEHDPRRQHAYRQNS